MIETDRYNKDLPRSLKPTGKNRLKGNRTRVFRALNIRQDKNNPNHYIFPTLVNVPAMDRIFDPKTQKSYDIACIKRIKSNGDVEFHEINFEGHTGCRIILNGNNPTHVHVYDYLMMSNFNRSNPNRDPSVQPIFELVDDIQQASDRLRRRHMLREALNRAADMPDRDVKILVAARGHDDSRPMQILRDLISDWAEKDPEAFMKEEVNKKGYFLATIKRALRHDVIKLDKRNNTFKWADNNEKIFQAHRGSDAGESFTEFLLESETGDMVMRGIEKGLEEALSEEDGPEEEEE